jgi:hypothetical protein
MALPRLADTALEGIGSALPPHISIQGNSFTLIDSSGAQKKVEFQGQDGRMYVSPFLDVVIADLGKISKRFMDPEKPWTPDSSDPPLCYSKDGVVPAMDANVKQARTCAECPQNVRGSAVSKLTGTSIKACRDEKWMALVVPAIGTDMVFRFTLTPGSFKNFQGYIEKFKGQQFDMPDVVTRLAFVQGVNGVVSFEAVDHAPEPVKQAVEQARISGKTDVFVGRDGYTALAAPEAPAPGPLLPHMAAPTATGPFVPAPALTAAPTGQPIAPFASPQTTMPTVPSGAAASPSEPAKRTRRTQAQIAADNAAKAAQDAAHGAVPPQGGVFNQPAPAAPAAAPQAPFRPAPAPNSGAPFGMAAGAPPNADIKNMLAQNFGPPQGTQ